jgi:proteasome lid subunit RPN8/RPN11
LNGDDITFGEVKVREPERRKRPDRDKKFACLAYEVPGPADQPIFLDRRAADLIERHALSDTSVELGGILLGKECLDPSTGEAFVWITQSLEAKHYANTQASFTYTHDSWEEITRERDRRFPEYDIVGWYHTHPSFGIFLSHHDLFIHHNFFAQPLQVAYVVDPINQTRGFFQWRDGGMTQVAGYYLAADRGDRIALARLVNDLEQIPNSEGSSGGSFSPRLEAELIKMLTRPGQREVSSPVERLQTATIFGLLGMFLGVMGLAAVLGLSQLLGKIQQQNESIQALSHLVEQSASSSRLVSDTLTEQAGGANPLEFTKRYERAVAARDEANRNLAIKESMNLEIGGLNAELKTRLAFLQTDFDMAQAKLRRWEKDATEAPKLRERIANLEDYQGRQQTKLDEFADWLASPEGKEAQATKQELVRTRYWAYSGWAFTALLGIGLAASYFLPKPPPIAPLDGTEGPIRIDDPEHPTHRIV